MSKHQLFIAGFDLSQYKCDVHRVYENSFNVVFDPLPLAVLSQLELLTNPHILTVPVFYHSLKGTVTFAGIAYRDNKPRFYKMHIQNYYHSAHILIRKAVADENALALF